MANNYLQYSFYFHPLPDHTPEEVVEYIKSGAWVDNEAYRGTGWDILEEGVTPSEEQVKELVERLFDSTDFNPEDDPHKFENPRLLWISAEESGNPEILAYALHGWIKNHEPSNQVGFEYAQTCSKMRVGEFGGGGVYICNDGWNVKYSQEVVEDLAKEFGRE